MPQAVAFAEAVMAKSDEADIRALMEQGVEIDPASKKRRT
jgi:hypothetical protein